MSEIKSVPLNLLQISTLRLQNVERRLEAVGIQ